MMPEAVIHEPPDVQSDRPAEAPPRPSVDDTEILRKLDLLLQQQQALTAQRSAPPRKDLWDKMAASGALLVGLVGVLFTFVYQTSEQRQREAIRASEIARGERSRAEDARLQELELLTNVLPIITSDDEEKKTLAVRALSEFGSPTLAAIVATLRPSPGTAAGLNTIRASPDISPADRATVDKAFRLLPPDLQRPRRDPTLSLGPIAGPDAARIVQAVPEQPVRTRLSFAWGPHPPRTATDSAAAARAATGVIPTIIDIHAPRGTPVVALSDATVHRLRTGERGGISAYLIDGDGRTLYYYAHLSGYAPGIREGLQVRKGTVIGYVGDTGNAGTGNYHLHFSVAILADPDRWWDAENTDGWWEGRNLRPLDLLRPSSPSA